MAADKMGADKAERKEFETLTEEIREALYESDMHYHGGFLASFRNGSGMHAGVFDAAELIAGYVMHERAGCSSLESENAAEHKRGWDDCWNYMEPQRAELVASLKAAESENAELRAKLSAADAYFPAAALEVVNANERAEKAESENARLREALAKKEKQ